MQEQYFHLLAAGASFAKKRLREDKTVTAAASAAAPATDRFASFHIVPPLGDAKEVEGWRKAYSISVEGEDATHAPLMSFGELQSRFHVNPVLLENLVKCEWAAPTLVQSEALPVLLARRDLIVCAPTGSGKTAAFVLPMLERLGGTHVPGGPRALMWHRRASWLSRCTVWRQSSRQEPTFAAVF